MKPRPSKAAQIARWTVRGFMIVAILFIAIQRGSSTTEMSAVVLAILWALSLPVLLTWSWRLTRGRASWQRVAVTASVAAILLLAFATGARSLLG